MAIATGHSKKKFPPSKSFRTFLQRFLEDGGSQEEEDADEEEENEQVFKKGDNNCHACPAL